MLLKLDEVTSACSAEVIEALIKKLEEMDDKRRKGKAKNEKDAESENEAFGGAASFVNLQQT